MRGPFESKDLLCSLVELMELCSHGQSPLRLGYERSGFMYGVLTLLSKRMPPLQGRVALEHHYIIKSRTALSCFDNEYLIAL